MTTKLPSYTYEVGIPVHHVAIVYVRARNKKEAVKRAREHLDNGGESTLVGGRRVIVRLAPDVPPDDEP